MFERFTDRARSVVVLAQDEARLLGHNYIGTEHLLLGLLREGDGSAAEALASLGVGLDGARQQVGELVGPRQGRGQSGHIPFTPRVKKVLELSLREALQLGHQYIGPEHILLGLVSEGNGAAVQILAHFGVGPAALRAALGARIPTEHAEGRGDFFRQVRVRPGGRAEIATILAEIRDRLAAIEAHLGIGRPASEDTPPEGGAQTRSAGDEGSG